MKHFKILFLTGVVMLILVANLFSQGPDTLWTRTYGGEHDDCAYSIQETSDGGYIIAGWTRSFGAGNSDVYLIKTYANGDTMWTKTYGGEYDDVGYSVQETSDGGFIVAGYIGSSVYLIKTDSNGNLLWSEWYGGSDYDYGYSVQETSDNGYIIAGRISSFSAGGFDVYLIKTDSLGNTLWSKIYGGICWDAGHSVKETSDGGYIIAGCTMLDGEGWDVYLIKTYADGDTIWTKTYGGANWDVGYSVQETSDGGYIVAGLTESFGAGSFDIYLLKIDSLGNTLWTRTHGDVGWDEGYSVQETSDGGYIITGGIESFGAGGFDVYLIRTDSLGDTLWTKTYGGANWDVGYSVQETSDGGYIIAGKTKSFNTGLYDIYLIKTETDPSFIEEDEIAKPNPPLANVEVSPNPFRNRVNIKYCIEQSAESIELKIYDVSGRLVKDISLPTAYSLLPTVITWDGSDNYGKRVSVGIYFIKVKSGEHVTSRKLLKIK